MRFRAWFEIQGLAQFARNHSFIYDKTIIIDDLLISGSQDCHFIIIYTVGSGVTFVRGV